MTWVLAGSDSTSAAIIVSDRGLLRIRVLLRMTATVGPSDVMRVVNVGRIDWAHVGLVIASGRLSDEVLVLSRLTLVRTEVTRIRGLPLDLLYAIYMTGVADCEVYRIMKEAPLHLVGVRIFRTAVLIMDGLLSR